MGSAVLRNPQHELYAQGRASGLSKLEAYQKAGYSGLPQQASILDRKKHIRGRINELLEQFSNRAELSRKDILDRIFQDWDLARKLGQVPAALKAAELMGRELHKMFTERKEVGGPGDFDSKTEDELKKIVSDGLRDLGWEGISLPDKTVN